MNKLISAICSSLLLGVSLTTVHAQEFDRGIVLNTFIPKGQWVVGNSISYSEYSNDNYQFLVIENMDGIGYTFKVSPMFCYIVKDNLGLGGRFAYERSLTKLDNASIKIGDDLNFDMDNVYSLSHSYSGMAIMRNYISIGNSSRFGLFNELQLSLGGVLFDRDAVRDNAKMPDKGEPDAPPDGIPYVMVNGVFAVDDGVFQNTRSGSVIRY